MRNFAEVGVNLIIVNLNYSNLWTKIYRCLMN